MQKEIKLLTFRELVDNKDNFEVGTDDYTIFAIDKKGIIYKITDMDAEDVSYNMWEFLGIDAEYLDEEILDKAEKIGY